MPTDLSPVELARRTWHLGLFDPTMPAAAAGAFAATGPSVALPYVMAALRFPRRIAITDDLGSLTYLQLAHRIEQVTAALRGAASPPATGSACCAATTAASWN